MPPSLGEPATWDDAVQNARSAKARMRAKATMLDAYQPHKAGGKGGHVKKE
jgi:hypothetical protein